MNTDPQSRSYHEIRPTSDIPPAELTAGQWTELTEDEAKVLVATPRSARMTKLRELRPGLSHNQRKQSLKRRGLR